MDTLPTEVLVPIFEYLAVGNILACLKVCRRWHEVITGHGSLLSSRVCVLKCSSKIGRAKQLWNMVSRRQPVSVLMRNADTVSLQLLLKHHPSLTNLSVTTQLKHFKKVLRSICLFKSLTSLGIHVRGGAQLEEFSLEWVQLLPELRKISLTEIGCITDDNLRLSHLTLNRTGIPRTGLQNTVRYLTCIEVQDVTDAKFSILANHLHNMRVCILTSCSCTNMDFPPSLLRDVRIQGTVAGRIQLDKSLSLNKVVLSLASPLPECMLPGTVTELSVRGTHSSDPHWLLALSIACTGITKLDLKGFTLKSNIASSLGMRFPKLTHLNIMGCLARNVDHMYLIALLQEATSLVSLSCDPPYTCSLLDIRQVFGKCWLSGIDYRDVTVTSELPPVVPSSDVVLDIDFV